jgi:hypothetical protein
MSAPQTLTLRSLRASNAAIPSSTTSGTARNAPLHNRPVGSAQYAIYPAIPNCRIAPAAMSDVPVPSTDLLPLTSALVVVTAKWPCSQCAHNWLLNQHVENAPSKIVPAAVTLPAIALLTSHLLQAAIKLPTPKNVRLSVFHNMDTELTAAQLITTIRRHPVVPPKTCVTLPLTAGAAIPEATTANVTTVPTVSLCLSPPAPTIQVKAEKETRHGAPPRPHNAVKAPTGPCPPRPRHTVKMQTDLCLPQATAPYDNPSSPAQPYHSRSRSSITTKFG